MGFSDSASLFNNTGVRVTFDTEAMRVSSMSRDGPGFNSANRCCSAATALTISAENKIVRRHRNLPVNIRVNLQRTAENHSQFPSASAAIETTALLSHDFLRYACS